jgi:hypothetical protein
VRDAVAQRDPIEVGAQPRVVQCAPDEREARVRSVVVSVSDCTISKRRMPSSAE